MKKITLFTIATVMSVFAIAQKLKETEVPAAVKKSFAKAFPKAKDVKWSKESPEEIEVGFKSEGNEMSANFTNAGVWTGTETEIKTSELPKVVQNAIAKDYAGYKIKEAEKAEAPGKPVTYDTELEKGGVAWEVKFSFDGSVLKKEEKKEKDEKKD